MNRVPSPEQLLEARAVVATVTGGVAFAALDDFTLATPSLEDVYIHLTGKELRE